MFKSIINKCCCSFLSVRYDEVRCLYPTDCVHVQYSQAMFIYVGASTMLISE